MKLKIVFIRLLIFLYVDVYDYSTNKYKSSLRFLKKLPKDKSDSNFDGKNPRLGFKRRETSFIDSSNSELSLKDKREHNFISSFKL